MSVQFIWLLQLHGSVGTSRAQDSNRDAAKALHPGTTGLPVSLRIYSENERQRDLYYDVGYIKTTIEGPPCSWRLSQSFVCA